MKLALLGLCALPLHALRPASSAVPPADDPPPVECPLCGGDVELHARLISGLTLAQLRLAHQALISFWS